MPYAALCAMSQGSRHRVVRGATEDEQQVHLLQAAQLHLTDGAGLLEPSKSWEVSMLGEGVTQRRHLPEVVCAWKAAKYGVKIEAKLG